MNKQNGFKKLKVLGQGAFGEVFLVENEFGMKFAMKNMRLAGDEDVIQMIVQEANFLYTLNHPNIVRFHHIIKEMNTISIIMEFAEDGSLYDKIKDAALKSQPLSEEDVLNWTGQLCSALEYLHNEHIIHRDIKPQNILINSKGQLKLADLGIAKAMETTTKEAVTFAGTRPYMCPELLSHEPYTYKADMWAVGVLLYQLCTSRLPFKSIKEQIEARVTSYEGVYSGLVHQLILRTLTANPDERYSSTEVLGLINKYMAQEEKPLSQKMEEGDDTVKMNFPKENEKKSEKKKFGNILPESPKKESEKDSDEPNEKTPKKSAEANEKNPKKKRKSKQKQKESEKQKKQEEKPKEEEKQNKPNEEEKVDNKPHVYTNGDKYTGTWKDGKKEGKGTMIYSQGTRYEGEFKNDVPEGKGACIYNHPKIFKYEGDWRNGMPDGVGTMMFISGEKYVGQWKSHQRHGKGINYTIDGSTCEGYWVNGLKHGKCKEVSASGQTYTGDYVSNKKEGRGLQVFPAGNNQISYEGEFKNDMRNGKGVSLYKGDIAYLGTYLDDAKLDGRENRPLPNGDRIEFIYKDGKCNGDAMKYCTNGDRWEGNYVNNVLNGKATRFLANGDKFTGEFVNGVSRGKGKFWWNSGTQKGDIFEGYYDPEFKDGHGTYYYANGDVFKGEYINKVRQYGMLICANGDKYDEIYECGKVVSQKKINSSRKSISSRPPENRKNQSCQECLIF